MGSSHSYLSAEDCANARATARWLREQEASERDILGRPTTVAEARRQRANQQRREHTPSRATPERRNTTPSAPPIRSLETKKDVTSTKPYNYGEDPPSYEEIMK